MLVSGAVISIGAAGIGSMGLAHAATSTSTNPQQSLIDKLVATFNLNKSDVQKVFEENRSARAADQEQKTKVQLDQLVKDGKITADQEYKLIAKAKELKTDREANRDAMQSKTDTERKAAIEAERTALNKWLSDNGIAQEYGRFLMGHGGPGGHMGHMGPPKNSQNSN